MQNFAHIQENLIASQEKNIRFGIKAVETSFATCFENIRAISGISKVEDVQPAMTQIMDNSKKFGDALKNIHTAWMGSLSK